MNFVNRDLQPKMCMTMCKGKSKIEFFYLLASLRPEFEDTKRDIFMRPQLPSFNTVCSIIQSEETRRRVMHSDSIVAPSIGSSEHFANAVSSNAKQSDGGTQFVKGKGKKPLRFHCDHCDRDGHSKE